MIYELRIHRKRIRTKAAEALTAYGRIDNPRVVVPFFRSRLTHEDREQFMAVYLDVGLKPLAFETIAIGTSTSVEIDVRLIMRSALLAGAHSIIVCHNHPSGRAQPSTEDDALTQRVGHAAELMGMMLQDHLVITSDDFYSYREALS